MPYNCCFHTTCVIRQQNKKLLAISSGSASSGLMLNSEVGASGLRLASCFSRW